MISSSFLSSIAINSLPPYFLDPTIRISVQQLCLVVVLGIYSCSCYWIVTNIVFNLNQSVDTCHFCTYNL
ncbi:hypothetical protein VN97_g8611 [Penicillium thymicola]|uniref:Uncharacterized protein n=1 Tax=Penicillium thymicola TaxID=293382 RepID=A0AAI9X697_PENTH|nr:hypothetical protein VN97_g8611 [Penicillium thymicola]